MYKKAAKERNGRIKFVKEGKGRGNFRFKRVNGVNLLFSNLLYSVILRKGAETLLYEFCRSFYYFNFVPV